MTSSQITATVSVTLVLLILGIVALTGIISRNISSDVRERVGFVVVMDDKTSDTQINQLKSMWQNAPYVSTVTYLSADDVLHRWKELMDDDEDIVETLGVNPFFPEFEVRVRADYAYTDSLIKITRPLAAIDCVNEVKLQTAMVDSINSSMKSVALVLVTIAGALLLISFMLINNTVRLTIYSRRFTIHTMKLVGATAGFIRRPFVTSYMLNGIVSAFVAIGILCVVIVYVYSIDPEIYGLLSWAEAVSVFIGLILAGMLICTTSAILAANKYLRSSYDNMFK